MSAGGFAVHLRVLFNSQGLWIGVLGDQLLIWEGAGSLDELALFEGGACASGACADSMSLNGGPTAAVGD